jgi:hypothetical protein
MNGVRVPRDNQAELLIATPGNLSGTDRILAKRDSRHDDSFTSGRVIDIVGERAVARKKFNGVIARVDGGSETLDWQTLYFCARRDDAWKITSFVGYLPRLLGEDHL